MLFGCMEPAFRKLGGENSSFVSVLASVWIILIKLVEITFECYSWLVKNGTLYLPLIKQGEIKNLGRERSIIKNLGQIELELKKNNILSQFSAKLVNYFHKF